MNSYKAISLKDKKGFSEPSKKKGKVTFIDNFISESKATKLYKKLIEKTPWEHGVYKMFGKDIKTPRLLWAMRDDEFDIEK